MTTACRAGHLQLRVCSLEGGGGPEQVSAGGRAEGPQEETPGDPPVPGGHGRDASAQVRPSELPLGAVTVQP